MSVRLIDVPDGAVDQRDAWIPLRDGVRLHARVWLPAGAADHPVPALLEYLPYRLDDWTSVRDSERHPYYALHGYASVRVDIRGHGSSDGFFDDEYSETELDDGEQVIAWLAAQPWCDGAVGMFGISWGGFNALQLAARRPPALKAIVTVCSSVDRYANDVHYIGGAVLGLDMAAWAATMLAFAARPPRPEVVGDGWVTQWHDRLERLEPLAPIWLAHQERDAYWRHGSVCEEYESIDAAVLAVGGWNDPYHDTVLRVLENLTTHRKGLLGPWPHQYPDRDTAPGPPIGFLQETLRWWERWLKGIETGVEDDPDLRVWIADSRSPAAYVSEPPGRWRGIATWPAEAESRAFRLAEPPRVATVASPWATGREAGRFFPIGNLDDLPPDQRLEDERSVCADVPVGPDPVEVLGFPDVRLRLRASHDRAHVIVRLCDIAADGSSLLVSRGVLNLLHRHGMDRVDPLTPGVWEDVTVPLMSAAHRFAPGHRIRLAISNHYWPWVWPHENDGELEVDLANSWLDLPLAVAGEAVSFGPAEHCRPLAAVRVGKVGGSRVTEYDPATRRTTLRVVPDYGGGRRYPDGLRWVEEATETYTIVEHDPLSAAAESRWEVSMDAPRWGARVETWSKISVAPGEFVIENQVRARARRDDGDLQPVAERHYRHRVPRTSG